jgi:2-dehydro-3-deoxyphosphogluconate aldolase/(4S)-4-hydroxy-2-oxoglutarate aldolase
VKKEQVRARIEEIGIVAAIRVSKSDDAYYAAETVYNAGIPVAEITMTVPGAIDVIRDLATRQPDMVVGAGTVLDQETARRCVDAGAKFLTSPGLVLDVVDFALKNDVVVFPGVLTATEVIMAWKAGVDFIKIFPCAQVGGDRYIRALKIPFPNVPLIASGGVNQQTAANFILAGATALGIGSELIPKEALMRRQETWIGELARRFTGIIRDARNQRLSVEDRDAKPNQHKRGDDMAVAPNRRAEPAMIHHPARECAPQCRHGGKDHCDDGNLTARVDSKGRYIDAEVVAPVRYGHQGHPGDGPMATVLDLGTVTA